MAPSLAARGGQYYHLNEREGRQLNLSKASLGAFCYELLKVGGELIQLWPFNIKYDRSAVYPVVAMTPDQKAIFEEKTGFKLSDPPKVVLS